MVVAVVTSVVLSIGCDDGNGDVGRSDACAFVIRTAVPHDASSQVPKRPHSNLASLNLFKHFEFSNIPSFFFNVRLAQALLFTRSSCSYSECFLFSIFINFVLVLISHINASRTYDRLITSNLRHRPYCVE